MTKTKLYVKLYYMVKNLIPKFFGRFLLKKEAVGQSLADYFAFKPAKFYWLVIGIVNLLLWLLAWLIQRGLKQDLAILHYNVTFGIDYLAPRGQVFWLPVIALVLFLLNGWLAFLFFKKDTFLANLMLVSALMVNLLVGLGLYSIYLVNFVKIF